MKPVALVADAIMDASARGEIVLDSFLGSGTTLIAAERTGRICCGIEIDPLYVDTIIRRWQKFTGLSATHAASSRSFNDLEFERRQLIRWKLNLPDEYIFVTCDEDENEFVAEHFINRERIFWNGTCWQDWEVSLDT